MRVVASGYYQNGESAEFTTIIKKFSEHTFLVTAEKVESKDQLNSHLKYMNTQDNEIILKGYSTNWKFSTLKFKLSGKDESEQEDNFSKNAEWLVRHLIDPQWVVSIRVKME